MPVNKKLHPVVGNPSDPQGFEHLLKNYLEWLSIKNYSQRSIRGWNTVIHYFIQWCGERGILRPVEVTKAILERYQRWVYHYRKADGTPLKFTTQHTMLHPLRIFFKWCSKNNHTLYNPASEMELPKLGSRLPKHGFNSGRSRYDHQLC
jgi:integrase/recombinase XerD